MTLSANSENSPTWDRIIREGRRYYGAIVKGMELQPLYGDEAKLKPGQAPGKPRIKKCGWCGVTYEARKITSKSCSPQCARKLQGKTQSAKTRKNLPTKCPVCGIEYTPKDWRQLTCSAKCGRISGQANRSKKK